MRMQTVAKREGVVVYNTRDYPILALRILFGTQA